MPVTIFFCYAREDEALLNKLKSHLSPLKRQGLIDIWYDRDINAGTEWEPEIKEHLNAAQIILLLVSPDFMESDYCYGVEMRRALERRQRGKAEVIPIILRPVDWQGEPLGRLQALPTDGKPVTSKKDWDDQDTALYDVSKGIRKVVMQLTPLHVKQLTLLLTLTGHEDGVWSVAISPAGQILFSGSADQTIKVWELSTGKLVRTLTGHTGPVDSVAISPDGQTLVSSGIFDDTIKVWELSTGKLVRTLTGHQFTVSVTISPDGRTLISGSADDTIKVWELSTGKLVRTLTGHQHTILSVRISPDGRTLVSGSADQTIKVWELSSGKLVRTLTGHAGSVLSVAISPDGQALVSGSLDHTIKVWELSSGKLVHTLTGHEDGVRSVAISPAAGQILVSGSADHTIKVWGA